MGVLEREKEREKDQATRNVFEDGKMTGEQEQGARPERGEEKI